MKTLALFTAAALFATFVGCQENAVEPILGEKAAKPAALAQTIQIKEDLEFTMPDGRREKAEIAGEVTYRLVATEMAALAKEIPPKVSYSLTLFGKGQLITAGAGLAKPEVWSFSGSLSSVIDDGRGVEAIFAIDGTKWVAHYHVTFILVREALAKGESEVDFHADRN